MDMDPMQNPQFPHSQNSQVGGQSLSSFSGMEQPAGPSNPSQTVTPVQEIDPFTLLERKLDGFQETARYIGIIASDFNQKNQDTLNAKIYELIHGLQELDRIRMTFDETKVPLEILNFLDEGKNPQLYSREILERTVTKNKEVNGKIEIYKKFRAHLLGAFAEEMPDMVLQYRNLRGETDDDDAD